MSKPNTNPYHLKKFYNNIKNLPLLYKYQFVILFIRGGNIDGDDLSTTEFYDLFKDTSNEPEKTFTYYAQSASIPEVSVKNATANFFGGKFNIPAVIQYNHDWKTEIMLDEDLTMYKKLVEWQHYMSNYKYSGGGVRVIPNINLRVNLLDNTHSYYVTSFILAGIWPNDILGINLLYNNSSLLIKVPISFKYQYVYEDVDFKQTYDPLKI